jgi:hypothetical protein
LQIAKHALSRPGSGTFEFASKKQRARIPQLNQLKRGKRDSCSIEIVGEVTGEL